MIISVKKYPWQCIECKSCGLCGTSDNDVSDSHRLSLTTKKLENIYAVVIKSNLTFVVGLLYTFIIPVVKHFLSNNVGV